MQNILFQRSAVNTNPNGDMSITAGFYHGMNAITSANVAWIDSDFIDAGFNCCNCQPIIELNIGNQWDIHFIFDGGDQPNIIHSGNGQAYDITASLF